MARSFLWTWAALKRMRASHKPPLRPTRRQARSRLATCVAELIVRSEHHQDFHVCLSCVFSSGLPIEQLPTSDNTTSAETQTIGRWYQRYFGSGQGHEFAPADGPGIQ